jgi:hypothetical protein
VDSLGGKVEEWRGRISSKSHENPGGLTSRKGGGEEGMYQLRIAQKPLGGFTRRKEGKRVEMYQLQILRKSW